MPAQENSEQPITVVPRVTRPRVSGSSIPDVTPPIPIMPRITPYIPGPSPRCSRTSSGSSAQGAEAGIE